MKSTCEIKKIERQLRDDDDRADNADDDDEDYDNGNSYDDF